MNRDWNVIFLVGLCTVLVILLIASIWQNQQILEGWRQAQEFWQSLPLEYPEVGK